jgi:hypothetical protein
MTSPFTSVVEVTLGGDGSGGDALGWWAVEGAAVRRALVEHYGRDIAGDALTPPHEPGELRSRLRGVAPQLSELTTRVRRAFDEQLACAVIVPQFGVTDADTDDKRKAVFAFGALIGDPTANFPFDQVFWDVKNNGAKATRHTAFSENDRDADYHADNGSFRAPERFFLLYVVREACCGGGVSMIRDGRVLITQLERTPQGRRAVEVLKKRSCPGVYPERSTSMPTWRRTATNIVRFWRRHSMIHRCGGGARTESTADWRNIPNMPPTRSARPWTTWSRGRSSKRTTNCAT